MYPKTFRWWLLLPPLLLGACSTLPPDDGSNEAAALLEQDGYHWHDSMPVPQGELDRATAITRALAANPRMQVEYQRLNISAVEVVRATEVANPWLSVSSLRPHGGGGFEWGVGISQSLSGMLMRGLRRDMAEVEYQLASLHLARAAQHLALETEAAWFALVEAEQTLAVQQLISRADRLADALADRFHQAGNMHGFARAGYAERGARGELALLRAQRQRDLARERLAELMAMPAGNNDWHVPLQLPMPIALDDLDEVSLAALAQSRRPDIRMLKAQQALHEQGLMLARRYRWLGDLELGIKHERELDGARLTGPTLAVGVPLLNRNRAGVLRAEGQAALAASLLNEREQEITWQVRRKLHDLRYHVAAFDVRAKNLLPEHANLVERRQERVNFMFDGVFDLLETKANELRAWQEQVTGLGEFWQHWIELSRVLGGYPPVGDDVLQTFESRTLDTSVLEHDPEQGGHHEHHHHDHHHDHHQGHHGEAEHRHNDGDDDDVHQHHRHHDHHQHHGHGHHSHDHENEEDKREESGNDAGHHHHHHHHHGGHH